MIEKLAKELLQLPRVTTHAGLTDRKIEKFKKIYELKLPDAHLDFLHWSNGVEVYGGFLKIFGVLPDLATDLIQWNCKDAWRFAWGHQRCTDYLFIGQTAWGDQIAYNIENLRSESTPAVFFLDGISMSAYKIADSIEEYLHSGLFGFAKDPKDEIVEKSRVKMGDIGPLESLIYLPSLLLGGREDPENLCRMESAKVMIINGDLATQIDNADEGQVVSRLVEYRDACGRGRIRIEFT